MVLEERYIARERSTDVGILLFLLFMSFICVVTTLQNPSFGFGTGCAIYPASQRMGPDPDILPGKDISYRQPQIVIADPLD